MSFVYPADVDGYPNEDEARALYEYACAVPENGAIVELGSYKGRSAISMAQAGRQVYCVDRFEAETEEKFKPRPDHLSGNFSPFDIMKNAARYGVSDWISVRVDDTAAAGAWWTLSHKPAIDLLFIDAGHDYDRVHADAEAWLPLVKDDGMVVFDDSIWEGVSRVIHELDDWVPIPGPQVGGLTAMKRLKETADARP